VAASDLVNRLRFMDNSIMQRLDLTLATPAENIALDEALLDWAEELGDDPEYLRLWEPATPIVVVGRSTRVQREVDEQACRRHAIPILRRASGGAAIVAGPGCLMYAVVLSYRRRPELKDIGRAHKEVLGRLANALRGLGFPVEHAGTSDLAIEHPTGAGAQGAIGSVFAGLRHLRKFSGNSLRAKRSHLLYHGTLLYSFDLTLVASCLRLPPRMPNYRAHRPHGDFLTNLPLDKGVLIAAIDAAWPTEGTVASWPSDRVAKLVTERFAQESWNFEFR
jgi:lipoate-protein ligase A